MERTLDDATIAQLAEHCERAELEKREIIKLTDDYPDMNFADATAVQWQMRRNNCLLYTSPSPRDTERSRMPSSA